MLEEGEEVRGKFEKVIPETVQGLSCPGVRLCMIGFYQDSEIMLLLHGQRQSVHLRRQYCGGLESRILHSFIVATLLQSHAAPLLWLTAHCFTYDGEDRHIRSLSMSYLMPPSTCALLSRTQTLWHPVQNPQAALMKNRDANFVELNLKMPAARPREDTRTASKPCRRY